MPECALDEYQNIIVNQQLIVSITHCSGVSTPEKASSGERRSRIHTLDSQRRESGDGMDASELAGSDHKLLRVSRLMSQYEQYQESGEDQGEELDE